MNFGIMRKRWLCLAPLFLVTRNCAILLAEAEAVAQSYQHRSEGALRSRNLDPGEENLFQRSEVKNGEDGFSTEIVQNREHTRTVEDLVEAALGHTDWKEGEGIVDPKDSQTAVQDTAAEDELAIVRTPRQAASDCQLNAQGFFGVPEGEVFVVDFLYQTTVVAGTTKTEMNSDVAPALDVAIPQALLPQLFDDCGRRRRRHLQEGTPRAINAVSSLQADTFVLAGLDCVGNQASDCYIAQGSITFLATGFRNLAELEDVVLPLIQTLIQGGAVDNVSPLVTDVVFLTDDLTTVPPVEPLPPSFSPPSILVTASPIATPVAAPAAPPVSLGTPTVGTPAPTIIPLGTFPPAGTVTNPPSAGEIPPPSGEAPVEEPTAEEPSGEAAKASDEDNDDGGGESGVANVDWWGWFLASVGAACLILCCYSLIRGRESGVVPTTGSAEIKTSGQSKEQAKAYDTPSHDSLAPDSYEPPPSFGVAPMEPTIVESSQEFMASPEDEASEREGQDEMGAFVTGRGQFGDNVEYTEGEYAEDAEEGEYTEEQEETYEEEEETYEEEEQEETFDEDSYYEEDQFEQEGEAGQWQQTQQGQFGPSGF